MWPHGPHGVQLHPQRTTKRMSCFRDFRKPLSGDHVRRIFSFKLYRDGPGHSKGLMSATMVQWLEPIPGDPLYLDSRPYLSIHPFGLMRQPFRPHHSCAPSLGGLLSLAWKTRPILQTGFAWRKKILWSHTSLFLIAGKGTNARCSHSIL